MLCTHQVRFLPGNETISVQDGTTLLDAARGVLAVPDALCGGNGTCGKCTAELIDGEKRKTVLACQTAVTCDLTVFLPETAESRTAIRGTGSDAFPIARDSGYAAAFDIGTTTLVCYLLDRATGAQIASSGALNPQVSFGADVITRAKAALEGGAGALQAALIGGMNRLLAEVSAQAGIPPQAITLCAIVGNSVMQHLLLGFPIRSLVSAPYVPDSLDAVMRPAASLGLCIDPAAPVRVLPLIGGFVGADTVGCLLATDFWRLPGNTLLMDIGTNGELALNAAGKRFACSAAAGPALEGGSISCGMRGTNGAISRVWLERERLAYDVLGKAKPKGLCGSGLIDLIACLIEAGAIEPSGRMREQGPLAGHMCRTNGMRAFRIADASETENGTPLLLTQKDVREVQLAKSALFCGISLLADAAGIPISAIDRVLLAGAFGNTLSPESACAIGLLPRALLERVQFVGNAAGTGACLAAQSDAAFAFSTALARSVRYIDQAECASFQQRFLNGLAFPAPPAKM